MLQMKLMFALELRLPITSCPKALCLTKGRVEVAGFTSTSISRWRRNRLKVEVFGLMARSLLWGTATTVVLASLQIGSCHQCPKSLILVKSKHTMHAWMWRGLLQIKRILSAHGGLGVLGCLLLAWALMMHALLWVRMTRRIPDTWWIGGSLRRCRKRSLRPPRSMNAKKDGLVFWFGTSFTILLLIYGAVVLGSSVEWCRNDMKWCKCRMCRQTGRQGPKGHRWLWAGQ